MKQTLRYLNLAALVLLNISLAACGPMAARNVSSVTPSGSDEASAQGMSASAAKDVTKVQQFMLRNVGSGKCLDIPNGNAADGLLIQQYDCSRTNPNQQFLLVSHSDGSSTVISKVTRKAFDLPIVAAGANGSRIQQWSSTNAVNQKFVLNATAQAGFQFQSMFAPGKCLDVPTQSLYTNGTKVQVYNCTGALNQSFQLM